MKNLPIFIIAGIPFGCVYALGSSGLVLSYKTSGLLNLAFGAQAFIASLLFNYSYDAGWPFMVSFLVWVVLFSFLLGVIFDKLLFQKLKHSSTGVKLVGVLGLLIALPSIAQAILGQNSPQIKPFFFSTDRIYFRLFSYPISGENLQTVIVTVVVIGLLTWLLKYSRIGLAMKAVVESPKLSQLNGISAERISSVAFGISGILAGLSGVLLAPILHEINSYDLTLLVVAGTAGAACGGLSSLPLTFAFSIGLGILQEVIAGYVPQSFALASSLRPSLPFIVLVFALLFNPKLRNIGQLKDPMAEVDPPQRSILKYYSYNPVRLRVTVLAVVLVTFISVTFGGLLSSNWKFVLCQGCALAVIFLSITLLTGSTGVVSLAQATFAGCGAFLTAQVVERYNLPVLIALSFVTIVCVFIGLIVAVMSLKLQGLGMALLTLGFALLADNLIFPSSWFANGSNGVYLPRPVIGSISFNSDENWFIFEAIVLVLIASFVIAVRSSKKGLEALAISGSEAGAQAIGLSYSKSVILFFCMSAGIAGFGGGLYGITQQNVSGQDFNWEFSLLFLVLVIVMGVRSIEGAVVGAFAYVIAQELLDTTAGNNIGLIISIAIGLLALIWVLDPEGLVERQNRIWASTYRSVRLRRNKAAIYE